MWESPGQERIGARQSCGVAWGVKGCLGSGRPHVPSHKNKYGSCGCSACNIVAQELAVKNGNSYLNHDERPHSLKATLTRVGGQSLPTPCIVMLSTFAFSGWLLRCVSVASLRAGSNGRCSSPNKTFNLEARCRRIETVAAEGLGYPRTVRMKISYIAKRLLL